MKNEIIKNAMKKNRVFTWQVAELMGISENTLYRRMRHELPADEQIRIVKLIESGAAQDSEAA